MNIGYHSNFMDRIIERTDKRQERMEKMINKMLDKSEKILQAGMTNEQYIRSCSAEQLAALIYYVAAYDELYDRIRNAEVIDPRCDDMAGILEVDKWLKEKHNG